jgi:DNA repair protein RAD7
MLIGAADYVPDSESDEEDCVLMGGDGMKVPAHLSASRNVIDLNVFPMDSQMTDEGRRDGSVRAGEGGSGEVNIKNEDLLNGDSMRMHGLAEETAGGIAKPLTSPVGISAAAEAYVDMKPSEDLLRHEAGNKGEGKGKLVLGNNDSAAAASVGVRAGARTRKFSRDDKGKGKMVVEEDSLPRNLSNDEIDLEPVASEEKQSIPGAVDAPVEPLWRQAARERAIKLAPKFAFFKADEDVHSDEDEAEELEPPADNQDWPGPYSTAVRIIDDRDARKRARELNPSKVDNVANKVISWTPSKDKKTPMRLVPSLTSLCLRTLANHAEGIVSLGGISEELKQKLLRELCHSRKMTTHLLTELLCDNPVTLQLSECSWLNEDDFMNIFGKCVTESLEVLLFTYAIPI